MNRWVPLEEKPQKALFPFPSSQDTARRKPLQNKEQTSPCNDSAGNSDLELPTLQNWEKCLLFISHPVYGNLLEQRKSTEILLEKIKGISPPIPPLPF